MPELPEVETIRRDLAPALCGARVEAIWSSGKALRLRRLPCVDALGAATVGRGFLDVRRRGKYLLLDVEGGAVLVVHLGMSGQLRLEPAAAPRAPHAHLAWTLEGGRELRFVDPRRFGAVTLATRGREEELAELARLGVDPLGTALTGAWLHERARTTRRDLKSLLLDQRLVAGLGNIYACEALHEARLHPAARGRRLGTARASALRDAIVLVLERGLANRGTTLRDYVDAAGRAGSNRAALRVYGREGEPCLRGDGGSIRRVVRGGRSSFFCPRCQRS